MKTTYLLTAEEMREMDRRTIESFGIPGRVLMENAGRGATRLLLETFGDLSGKKIGVLSGKGNNGGDGFVVARYLSQAGIAVTVYLLAKRDLLTGDAAANFALLAPLKIPVIEMSDEQAFFQHELSQDIWVDAILGTGLSSDVKGYFKTVIEFVNASYKPVFAIDIPSGLNSDTGQSCGTCIRAKATATFAYPKIGHFLYPGAAYCGKVSVVNIGIPNFIAKEVNPKQYLLTPESFKLVRRSPDAHKGQTGHLLVIAGSPGKTGAAVMTALSAMRAGAGLVTLGIPKSTNPIVETLGIEVMTCPLPETEDGALDESAYEKIMELFQGKQAIAIGPGLGQAEPTRKLIHQLVRTSKIPMVIDADGLNALSSDILKERKAKTVLTPHPGEMARLTGMTTADIQKDRILCARKFATELNVHLVLKGAGTVVAHPDGKIFVNATGNSGMASGGMGDVLTGVIGGLIAQGMPPEEAARAGVYLHGAAADKVARQIGSVGFLATEVMAAIPQIASDFS
jgi:NAD(P)H-hydrate epimerase